MGFYIRKSLKVGPLRFNLSKSGVGVSAGVKGFRVGTGPRGNYVHLGAGGIYYRKTFSSNTPASSQQPSLQPINYQELLPEVDSLVEIDSGSVEAMRDASSADLLDEINEKRKKPTWFSSACILTAIIWFCFLGILSQGTVGFVIFLGVILAGIYFLKYVRTQDQLRKTVVLFYDLDGPIQASYEAAYESFERLAVAGGTWHIEASGGISDTKRNAGATTAIRRQAVRFSTKLPPFLSTNIDVPCLPAGKESLYFFPDRILVFDNRQVGAVGYQDLNIEIENTRFIEEGIVPRDAEIVGHTWKYVNKKGGPDKRFKDNPQIPIALYGELILTSKSGLQECFQISNKESMIEFAQKVLALTKTLKSLKAESGGTLVAH